MIVDGRTVEGHAVRLISGKIMAWDLDNNELKDFEIIWHKT